MAIKLKQAMVLLDSNDMETSNEEDMSSRMNGCSNGSYNSSENERNSSTKIFCDPIHGQMSLHPACVAIIDTPQFQRLRNIKQTGFLDYVFPGSVHNRFSHSLGVCFLAGRILRALKERQPELHISNVDVLCVELAGLCHDLGHGPYSHTWEKFMAQTSGRRNDAKKWRHEAVSAKMLDYLIEENKLAPVLEGYGVGSPEIQLIKDYITGVQPEDGRRTFFYQIVNNDDSGLDVDKWDYFLRDCYYLGLKCSFEYQRLIEFAKVLVVDGKFQICYRDKVMESVYDVFRTRSNLHRLAYQHKMLITVEEMFLDAFHIVDGKVSGPSGEILEFYEWSMKAACADGHELKKALARYCMLTDNVVMAAIRNANQPEIKKAADIVRSIETRSCKSNGIYQHVGMKPFYCLVNKAEIIDGLEKLLPIANEELRHSDFAKSKEKVQDLTISDIIVNIVAISWGKGDKNPVDFVHFFSKSSVCSKEVRRSFEVHSLMPQTFQEIRVLVLCRRSDEFALSVAKRCYKMFWDSHDPTNGTKT